MTIIPETMIHGLTIRHAAELGEMVLAFAVDQIEPERTDGCGNPAPRMRRVPVPALLAGEIEHLVDVGTLEAHDASFTITFAVRPDDAAIMAWIVIGDIAIHTPQAGRTPFAPILCRIRRGSR